MKVKNLYKVYVKFRHELFIEYTQAYSKDQARVVAGRRIARKQGVMPVEVFSYMKQYPESYEVMTEVEYEEDERKEVREDQA